MKRLTIILSVLTVLAIVPRRARRRWADRQMETTISGKKVLGGHVDGSWTVDFTSARYTVTWER
jgi:hypothetical protein